MQELKTMVARATNELLAWTADFDLATVTLSASGAVIVWVTLKIVGGIIEEYARRAWFR